MRKHWTCPEGHHWHAPAEPGERVYCPECGLTAKESTSVGNDAREVGEAVSENADFGKSLYTVASGGLRGLLLGLFAVLAIGGAALSATVPEMGPRILLMAFCGFASVFFGWAAYKSSSGYLEVFEGGLIQRGLGGTTRIPFDKVTRICLGRGWGIGTTVDDLIPKATIHGTGEQSINLGSLETGGARKAMDHILDQVVPLLITQVLDRFYQGQTVQFGSLKMSLEGLGQVGQPTVGWNELDTPSFSPEGYRIFPYGRPQDTIILPLDSPNLHVVTWLVLNYSSVWGPAPQEPLLQPTSAPVAKELPPEFRSEPITAMTEDPATVSMPTESQSGPVAASSEAPPEVVPPPPPGQAVAGYPTEDARLGAVVCGRPKQTETATALGILCALLAIAAVVALAIPNAWIGAIIAVVLALFCLLGAMSSYDAGVAVYQKGIRSPDGIILWDDCRHITYYATDVYVNGAYTGRTVNLELSAKNGHIRVTGKGAQMEGVCQVVVDQVVPRLVLYRLEQLFAGGTVTIGKVTMTQDALEYDSFWGKRLRLSVADICDCRMEHGNLSIWGTDQSEPFITLKTQESDFHVFTSLLSILCAPPEE